MRDRMQKHGIQVGETPYAKQGHKVLRKTLTPLVTAVANEEDLGARVAMKLNVPSDMGQAAVAAVVDTIEEALLVGQRVNLRGFGSFEVESVNPSERHVEFIEDSELTVEVRESR